MRKLKLSFALPFTFLLVSAVVKHWSVLWNAWLVSLRPVVGPIEGLWWSLNAPGAFFFEIGVYLSERTRLPSSVIHIGFGQFLFILGGIVFWFFFGIFLDGRRRPASQMARSWKAIRVVCCFLVLVWGLYLFREGLRAAAMTDYLGRHVPGELLNGALVIAWSAFLVFIAGQRLSYILRPSGSTRSS